MTKTIDAVIWDFGGVITSSPFEAFNTYESQNGLPQDFIRSVNARNGDTNAWAQLERSEIDGPTFDELFAAESRDLGHEVRRRDVLALLAGRIRPAVVDALDVCKSRVKVGCITNNAPVGDGAGMSRDQKSADTVRGVLERFDHLIESSKIGLRKPDPRIYALMCEALDVDPNHCVYIDDLGINLKPARAMGMTTIKSVTEQQLLTDLKTATGFPIATG